MSMKLGKTGLEFANNSGQKIDPKWIQFNSEIAIRKGNKGWIINSRVDNWSSNSETYFDYLLTTYKYEQSRWEKDGDPKLWEDPSNMDGAPLSISNGNKDINNQNKTLVIKTPTGSWFNSKDWVSPAGAANTKNKIFEKIENWSGVWVDGSVNGEDAWIFGGIELYMVEKKYSQIFCKGEANDCFQRNVSAGNPKTEKPTKTDTWTEAKQGSESNNEKIQDMITGTIKGIIDELKESKGSWKKLEDVCGVDGDPDEEQKNQLRMYCSKGKTN